MYNREIKFGLAGLAFIIGIVMAVLGSWGTAIWLWILAGLVIFLYFRNENLLIAFWHLRKQNFPKATSWINKVKHPEKLAKGQTAYWYFLKGLVTSQQESIVKSEKFFRRAIDGGLKMKQNQAIAKLNLAMICMTKRRKREAMTLVAEAKKLDKYNMLGEQIKSVKDGLKRM